MAKAKSPEEKESYKLQTNFVNYYNELLSYLRAESSLVAKSKYIIPYEYSYIIFNKGLVYIIHKNMICTGSNARGCFLHNGYRESVVDFINDDHNVLQTKRIVMSFLDVTDPDYTILFDVMPIELKREVVKLIGEVIQDFNTLKTDYLCGKYNEDFFRAWTNRCRVSE